jgi:hypothetical protein
MPGRVPSPHRGYSGYSCGYGSRSGFLGISSPRIREVATAQRCCPMRSTLSRFTLESQKSCIRMNAFLLGVWFFCRISTWTSTYLVCVYADSSFDGPEKLVDLNQYSNGQHVAPVSSCYCKRFTMKMNHSLALFGGALIT